MKTMKKADVILLVKETRSSHGVHETVTEQTRQVFCEVRSVTRSEYYQGLNAGIQPEYVFFLALAEDYDDERIVKYNGKNYNVTRTYMTSDGGIEITVHRSDVN